jgi:hypothetical protein
MTQAVTEITFEAQVARISTMADGGLRIVLDAGEDAILAAAQLMEAKRFGVAGTVTFRPMIAEQSGAVQNAVATRSEWQSER